MMLDGLFRPTDWKTIKATARARIARKNVALGFSSALSQHHASSAPPEDDSTGDNAAAYDWEPFFMRFGDMLPKDAITLTMAACGRLMNDFHGYNLPCTPPTRAERMARTLRTQKQVFDCMLGMIEPLFGAKRSSKLHEFLFHAAEEIQLRNDFSMADTVPNEQLHEDEKAAYKCSNCHAATLGRQLLTDAQVRAILREEDDKVLKAQEVDLDGCDFGEEASAELQPEEADAASPLEEDPSAPVLLSEAGVSGGVRVSEDVLNQLLGLGSVARLLDMPAYAEVSFMSEIHFTSEFVWGALPSAELLRSSDSYYGSALHDCVPYSCTSRDSIRFGQVRAIVVGGFHSSADQCAVVQRFELAEPVSGSPLAAAGYQRLRWDVDSDTEEWQSLDLVPLSFVQRILHVVQDLQTLV